MSEIVELRFVLGDQAGAKRVNLTGRADCRFPGNAVYRSFRIDLPPAVVPEGIVQSARQDHRADAGDRPRLFGPDEALREDFAGQQVGRKLGFAQTLQAEAIAGREG